MYSTKYYEVPTYRDFVLCLAYTSHFFALILAQYKKKEYLCSVHFYGKVYFSILKNIGKV